MLEGKKLKKLNDLNKLEAQKIVAEAKLRIKEKRKEIDQILLKAYKDKLNGKN